MCGFAGIIDPSAAPSEDMLRQAGKLIQHRGPDHQGIYRTPDSPIGIVHQRLSILDLDPRANQPMMSNDGRYFIAYNGEVYNFQALKVELVQQGHSFSTTCDTEVIMKLYELKGEKCLDELNGMFAISIWDTVEQQLFLARDRLGIKPLYYSELSPGFAFSSDLKAFQAMPQVSKKINPRSIWQFLFFGYIPQPESIYQQVKKLLPGHWLKLDKNGNITIQQYWSIRHEPQHKLSHDASVEVFKGQFDRSVKSRLLSDVEVGAFSSGGLDSSAVIAHIGQPNMKTFTIGFEHQSNPMDLNRSREFSSALGLNQTITILGRESLGEFKGFLELMDEPLSEASILPLLHNFKVAKDNGVKVILSGDGADEIMGGYSYFSLLKNFHQRNNIPSSVLSGAGSLASAMLSFLPANSKPGKFRDLYIQYTLNAYLQRDISSCHQLIASQQNHDDLQKISKTAIKDARDQLLEKCYSNGSGYSDILEAETKTTLVNKHLSKVDKSSMANSVEARVPFLDHQLVEWLFCSQESLRSNKQILKQAVKGMVPETIIQDRKRGFNLPIKSWVNEYITAPGNEHIDFDSLESLGIIAIPELHQLIEENRKGYKDHSRTIWSLFVLSGWLRNNAFEIG